MIDLVDERATEKLAAQFAKQLEAGDVICLDGTLGAGKTYFARALIRNLCEDEAMEVPSPSFSLVQSYHSERFEILHMDWYRLEDPDELIEVGYFDQAADRVMIIEWSQKLKDACPSRRIEIVFHDVGGASESDRRRAEIKFHGDWQWKI